MTPEERDNWLLTATEEEKKEYFDSLFKLPDEILDPEFDRKTTRQETMRKVALNLTDEEKKEKKRKALETLGEEGRSKVGKKVAETLKDRRSEIAHNIWANKSDEERIEWGKKLSEGMSRSENVKGRGKKTWETRKFYRCPDGKIVSSVHKKRYCEKRNLDIDQCTLSSREEYDNQN